MHSAISLIKKEKQEIFARASPGAALVSAFHRRFTVLSGQPL
jgi:hypothetical protein